LMEFDHHGNDLLGEMTSAELFFNDTNVFHLAPPRHRHVP
jgi:hypothetical protein